MTNFVPQWVDMAELCRQICCHRNTVDKMVREGFLPPPRRKGGKQLWKWSEVDEYLSREGATDPEAERIRNGTRQAEANARH